MNIYSGTPYTYYISWSALDLHYYGVRYANHCHPTDFWKRYFTSSTYVKRLIKNYGHPDVIQIRKIFTSCEEAIKWESTVLRRIKALDKINWLNCANQHTRVRKNFDRYLSPNFGYIFSPLEKLNKSIQYKKHKWWNNGISQCFCETQPDDSYKRGRLQFNNRGAQIGASINSQKYWVTNGNNEQMIFKTTPIPVGYFPGRIQSVLKGKTNHARGTFWWTDGTITKMSSVSPGQGWRAGRR
jgi:hypothetical protein